MSRQTALFTVALLLTFISTQVVYTSASEPHTVNTTQKSKAKSKNGKRQSHKPRKHTTGTSKTKNANK